MITIAMYELFQGGHMILQQLRLKQVRIDTGTLIDDHYPMFIGKLHGLLRVRIMRGAIGIGADPFQKTEVAQQQSIIETLASDLWESLQLYDRLTFSVISFLKLTSESSCFPNPRK